LDKSLLKTKKKIDFDFEITQAKEQIQKLYIKYMDNISFGTIDYNANQLIILAKELEGHRYLINNKIK
jgi:hypothetical protein